MKRSQSVTLLLGATFVAVLASTLAGQAADEKQDKSAPLAVAVSFDHLLLRQNESANVDVWVTNSSDKSETVALSMAGTSRLHWRDGTCPASDKAVETQIALGTILPYSDFHRMLCTTVESDIVPGDYNILFSFEYHGGSSPPQSGVVATEKTVHLSFLGTDSIAGVPLAFSCFILPGFFFWCVAG